MAERMNLPGGYYIEDCCIQHPSGSFMATIWKDQDSAEVAKFVAAMNGDALVKKNETKDGKDD